MFPPPPPQKNTCGQNKISIFSTLNSNLLQEEAEARQLGIEILKPGDRAELVTGVTGNLLRRKEGHTCFYPHNKVTGCVCVY